KRLGLDEDPRTEDGVQVVGVQQRGPAYGASYGVPGEVQQGLVDHDGLTVGGKGGPQVFQALRRATGLESSVCRKQLRLPTAFGCKGARVARARTGGQSLPAVHAAESAIWEQSRPGPRTEAGPREVTPGGACLILGP